MTSRAGKRDSLTKRCATPDGPMGEPTLRDGAIFPHDCVALSLMYPRYTTLSASCPAKKWLTSMGIRIMLTGPNYSAFHSRCRRRVGPTHLAASATTKVQSNSRAKNQTTGASAAGTGNRRRKRPISFCQTPSKLADTANYRRISRISRQGEMTRFKAPARLPHRSLCAGHAQCHARKSCHRRSGPKPRLRQ